VTTVSVQTTPADAAECARILVDASRDRRTVRVAGAMTKSYIGESGDADEELRTSRLTGVVDHVPADLTVTVAGGMRIADLAAVLARAGQFLPLDPPHAEAATIGGVIAANSNGFWRARYGSVRDLLIGTLIALPDGTVVRAGGRVVKNVAGYDLNKLITGSFGTLGVIVEATLKVLPIPTATNGILASFARGADAFAAAERIARAASRAEAVVIERSGGRGAQGQGPLARSATDRWRLLVTARGEAPAVARAMTDARREVKARAGSVAALAGELSDLRELPARATDGALVRVAVPLAAQTAFADTAARLECFATLVADAGSGVLRMHLQGDDAAVIRDAEALLLAARMVGGGGRVERRAERLRARLSAWPTRPNGEVLMRRIKDAFDPAGVLEPGHSPA
jgi:glycolate oxidase FAD binding subunit